MTLPASADVVQSTAGRVEGTIVLGQGEVRAGGKSLPLEQVVSLVRQTPGRTISAPQALRMKSGEVWCVEVVRVLAKKVRFISPLVGEREVDLAAVAAIDFVGRPNVPGNSAGTLYRDEGEPIPGSVIWIDPTRIALESPLGTLTLPREGLLRYVFSAQTAAGDGDEVVLVDGSVLRAKVKAAAGAFELEHPVLGAVSVPLAAVRSIRRQGVARFVDQLAVEQKSLTGAGQSPIVERGEAGETDQPFIQAFTLSCGASAKIDVAQGGTLKMTVGPVRGARSPAAARIVVAGKAEWEKTVGPQDGPAEVSVKAPAGQVSVEVEPAGSPVRFPAGVMLMDVRVEQ